MNHHGKYLLTTSLIAALGGCAGLQENDQKVQARQTRIDAQIAEMRQAQQDSQAARNTDSVRQNLNTAWVSNTTNAQPVVLRPPQLNAHIEINTATPLTISELTHRITMLTGLPIALAADVKLGPQITKPVSYVGTVEGLLNSMTTENSLSQKTENGGITLYRYETVVLRVKRKPGSLSTSTSIGVSGSSATSSSGTTGSSQMSATITGESKFSPWSELVGKIRAILSPDAKVQEAPSSSSIVITAVPREVEIARKVVEDDNKLATTPITVKIEVINISTTGNQNLGVNWNAVFNAVRQGNPYANVIFSTPASLATGNVGNFKISIPSGSSSRYANSDFLIEALNQVDKATTLLRRDFTTLHNVPSGFTRTNSKSYRARTTAAPASSVAGGGEPGVEPGQVTTGVRFVVTPTYIGDGQFSIEINYDDSFLRQLVALGIGKQQIDAPDVDGNQIYNVTTVQLGETSILNAFEVDTNNAGTSGFTADLTNSMNGSNIKQRIYMLITVTGGPV